MTPISHILAVATGFAATTALIYIARSAKEWREEWRAVRAFREAYKTAKIRAEEMDTIGFGGMDEYEVLAYAAEVLRTRADIKCGRHRFGASASEIVEREEAEAERARYQKVMTAPPQTVAF